MSMTQKELATKVAVDLLEVFQAALREESTLHAKYRKASDFEREFLRRDLDDATRRCKAAFHAWRSAQEAVPRG